MATIDPFISRHLADAQPDLYWMDTDPLEPESRSALIGSTTADLVIVGGGYTGLWTALLAKERDPSREVILLEQRMTGHGASGRNGGFCAQSLTHGYLNGKRRFPKEIGTIERMGRENMDEIEQTIQRYNIECDWEWNGELRVATEDWQAEGMPEEAEERNALGDKVEFLDADAVQSRIHSPIFRGALLDHDGTALLDPARLVWGLERACVALGVQIHENTKAEWLERDGKKMIVHTPYGEVTAPKVALGTNVYPSLVRRVRNYVVPVYDYVLVTEPLTPAQRESIGWAGREGVSDAGNQFHYYRLTPEGGILWGGWDAIYNYGSRVAAEFDYRPETYATLAAHFLRTFPQLEGIRFTHAWGGAIDTSTRFSSFWGTAYDDMVAYSLGYTGLGVAATRFGANVMLDLLSGEKTERTELQMVRRKPIPWPPEPFRYAGIQLTRRAIAKADANEGKRGPWLRTLDRLGLGFDS
jgi:glycine/D-amino acid oxidase-like deaminating enzyme